MDSTNTFSLCHFVVAFGLSGCFRHPQYKIHNKKHKNWVLGHKFSRDKRIRRVTSIIQRAKDQTEKIIWSFHFITQIIQDVVFVDVVQRSRFSSTSLSSLMNHEVPHTLTLTAHTDGIAGYISSRTFWHRTGCLMPCTSCHWVIKKEFRDRWNELFISI